MLPKYRSIGSFLECRQRSSEVVLLLISQKKNHDDGQTLQRKGVRSRTRCFQSLKGSTGGILNHVSSSDTIAPKCSNLQNPSSSLDIPPTQIKVYLQDFYEPKNRMSFWWWLGAGTQDMAVVFLAQNLTWNLKMIVSKSRISSSQGPIFRWTSLLFCGGIGL